MVGDQSYIEWYNDNAGRAYPLAEGASRVDDDGDRMDDDVLVDLGLVVPPGHEDVFVSSVRITQRTVSIGISSGSSGLLIGTYSRDDIRPLRSFPLTGVVDGVSGWVAFGDSFLRPTAVSTYHRFSSPAQSGIERRAVRVTDALAIPELRKYGGSPANVADGVVRLVAGSGLKIALDDTDPQLIVISVQPGQEKRFLSPCTEDADKTKCRVPPVRSISGVCPDENGRITIRFE